MVHFSQNIRWAAEDRGVGALYHFTWGENLPSILTNGLLSREDLAHMDIRYWITDDARWDDTPRAISLSIDSINYSMFDAKRNDLRRGWVILRVEREVLWTHSCRFCRRNASSSDIRNNRRFLGGPWGFDTMFKDEVVYISKTKGYRYRRVHYEIPKNLPTWNDAEVQVLEPIDRGLITDVIVGDDREKAWVEALGQQIGLNCVAVIDEFLAR